MFDVTTQEELKRQGVSYRTRIYLGPDMYIITYLFHA